MHPWKAHLTRKCPGRGRVLRLRSETFSNWTTTVDTCHVLHFHTSMMILAQMLRYLLTCWMGEILLFLCTWPSQQKRLLGDWTCYSAARRQPGSSTARWPGNSAVRQPSDLVAWRPGAVTTVHIRDSSTASNDTRGYGSALSDHTSSHMVCHSFIGGWISPMVPPIHGETRHVLTHPTNIDDAGRSIHAAQRQALRISPL